MLKITVHKRYMINTIYHILSIICLFWIEGMCVTQARQNEKYTNIILNFIFGGLRFWKFTSTSIRISFQDMYLCVLKHLVSNKPKWLQFLGRSVIPLFNSSVTLANSKFRRGESRVHLTNFQFPSQLCVY